MKNGPLLLWLKKQLRKTNSLLSILFLCLFLNSCKSNVSIDTTENYKKGLEYLNNSKFREAIVEFDKELENHKDNDQAYYNRGVAKSNLNYLEEAIKDFDKAVVINEKYYQAYFAKANSLKKLGRTSEALENYDLTIQINPKYENVYFNRASVYEELKKFDLSISDYLQAIQLNPNNYEYYFNLGTVYKKNNQTDYSIDSYKKTIEKNPQFSPAYNNLATALKQKENYTEALKNINEALKLDSNIDYLNNRGNIYRSMGNCNEAIKDYSQIIEKNKKYTNAYYGRALCKIELNLPDEAIEDFTTFLEIEPDNSTVLMNRGQIFVNLKNYEMACKDFEKSNALGMIEVKDLIKKYCK